MGIAMWLPENEDRLHYEVSKVLFRYARGVDRRDWDLLASVFHDGAYDDHGFQKGTAAQFIESMRRNPALVPQMMHLTSNVALMEVDAVGRRVLAESYCLGMQRLSPESRVVPPLYGNAASATGRVLTVANRYLDLFEEREGELRISRRLVIYEWHTVAPSGPHEIFREVTSSQRSPEDATYRTIDEFAAAPRLVSPDHRAHRPEGERS